MDVTARSWTGYQWRVTIIAMMCLGFGGWSLYDGVVGYPAQNKIADAWEQLPGENMSDWWHEIARNQGWPLDPREMIDRYVSLDEQRRVKEWPELAAEHGWPSRPEEAINSWSEAGDVYRQENWKVMALANGWPEDPADIPHHKTPLDIMTQFIMLAITAPIGLVFAFAFLRSFGRWIQCTDSQIITSKGQRVPFQAIKRLNQHRAHKGIVIVHFDHGGGERRLVLDDWKFQREAIGQIVAYLKEKLPADCVY